jgi:uncharacterized protein YodC (DUF2158 family)
MFKPGMKVHHKTGSPQMIISSVTKGGKFNCTYFLQGYCVDVTLTEDELEASDESAFNSDACAAEHFVINKAS